MKVKILRVAAVAERPQTQVVSAGLDIVDRQTELALGIDSGWSRRTNRSRR